MALGFVCTVGVQWSDRTGWAGDVQTPASELAIATRQRPSGSRMAAEPAGRVRGKWLLLPLPCGLGCPRASPHPCLVPFHRLCGMPVWGGPTTSPRRGPTGVRAPLCAHDGVWLTDISCRCDCWSQVCGGGIPASASFSTLLCLRSAGSFTVSPVVCLAPRSGEPGEGAAGGEAEGGPERASQTGG